MLRSSRVLSVARWRQHFSILAKLKVLIDSESVIMMHPSAIRTGCCKCSAAEWEEYCRVPLAN